MKWYDWIMIVSGDDGMMAIRCQLFPLSGDDLLSTVSASP